jgi:hypothetical protein
MKVPSRGLREACEKALERGPVILTDLMEATGATRYQLTHHMKVLGASASARQPGATWSLKRRPVRKWDAKVDDSEVTREDIATVVREALEKGPVTMFDLMAASKASRDRVYEVLREFGAKSSGRHRGAKWSLGGAKVPRLGKEVQRALPIMLAALKEGPQSSKSLMTAARASRGVVRRTMAELGATRTGYTGNQLYHLPNERTETQ